MKKALSILCIFILFIIIYLIQSNFFSWFTIAGVQPNLFIILAIFVGLYMGHIYGLTIGAVLGILLDLHIGRVIGINGIALGVAGLLAGIINKNVSKDSKMTIMLTVAGITFVSTLIIYLMQIAVLGVQVEILAFLRIILIETLYNVILSIIIYPLFQRGGNLIERIFTEKKILTRHF